MATCYICTFYSGGWCNKHNRGASPGGSCSSWRGSVGGSKVSGPIRKARTYKVSKCCGNCGWHIDGRCFNEKSQVYYHIMTTSSCCTAYNYNNGFKYDLKTKKKKEPRKNDPEKKETLKPVKKAIKPAGTQERCNRCYWYRNSICECKESTYYGKDRGRMYWCEMFKALNV